MDPEALKKLRLDRRLLQREGWISRSDLDKELTALPDVSDKIDDSDPEDGTKAESPEA